MMNTLINKNQHQIKDIHFFCQFLFSALIFIMLSATNVYAKDLGDIVEEITVPLTNNNVKGTLKVNQIYGSLTVSGYSGKEILVTVKQKQKTYKLEKKNGLTKIPNKSFDIKIEELDNIVTIKSTPHGGQSLVNLDIKVPFEFNLNLKSVNNGNTVVNNVNGELEVSHVNGNITLNAVSGSATLDTVNGIVKAEFKSIIANTQMAFSSLNGDIDITFPQSLKAIIKAKSTNGEIYSGFEIDIDKDSETVYTKGKQKYGFEQWTKGTINGGGSDMLFSNLNGDIYIRSSE